VVGAGRGCPGAGINTDQYSGPFLIQLAVVLPVTGYPKEQSATNLTMRAQTVSYKSYISKVSFSNCT